MRPPHTAATLNRCQRSDAKCAASDSISALLRSASSGSGFPERKHVGAKTGRVTTVFTGILEIDVECLQHRAHDLVAIDMGKRSLQCCSRGGRRCGAVLDGRNASGVLDFCVFSWIDGSLRRFGSVRRRDVLGDGETHSLYFRCARTGVQRM